MIGIAFDLGRAAFVAFHQQADGVRAEGHGGGVKLGLAEDQAGGLLDVGDDGLFRGAAAAGKAGESQRGGHEL
jgi:hypothetical protein